MPAVCPACLRSLLEEDTKTETMLKSTHTSLRRIENWLVDNGLIARSTISSMNAAVLARQISTQLDVAPKVNRERIVKIMGIFEQLDQVQQSAGAPMSAQFESSLPINVPRFPTPSPPDALTSPLPCPRIIPPLPTMSPPSIAHSIPRISADLPTSRARHRSVDVESSQEAYLPVTLPARHLSVDSSATPPSEPSRPRQPADPFAPPRIPAASPSYGAPATTTPTHARTRHTTAEFPASLPSPPSRKPALRSPNGAPPANASTHARMRHTSADSSATPPSAPPRTSGAPSPTGAPSEGAPPHSRTRHTSVDTATTGAYKSIVPSTNSCGDTLTKTPRYPVDDATSPSYSEARTRHLSVDTATSASYQSQKPNKGALKHVSAAPTAPAHESHRHRSSYDVYRDDRGAANTTNANKGDGTASAAPLSEHALLRNVTTPARSDTDAAASSAHQPRHNSVDGASRNKMPASDARPRHMSVDTATSAAHVPKPPPGRSTNRPWHNSSEAATSLAQQPRPPPSNSTDFPRHVSVDIVASAAHGPKPPPGRSANPPRYNSSDAAASAAQQLRPPPSSNTDCARQASIDAATSAAYQSPPSSNNDLSGHMSIGTTTSNNNSDRPHHNADTETQQPNPRSSSNSDRDSAEATAFHQLILETELHPAGTSSKCTTSTVGTPPDCDPSRPFSSHDTNVHSNSGFDPARPLSGFDSKMLYGGSSSPALTLNGFTKSNGGRCSPALSFGGRCSPPLSMCSRGTPPLSDHKGYMGRTSPALSEPQLAPHGRTSPPACNLVASPPVQRRATAPVRRVPYPTKKSSLQTTAFRANNPFGGRSTASVLARQPAGGSLNAPGCARERQSTPAFRRTTSDNAVLEGRSAALKQQGYISRSKEVRRSTLLAAAMAAAHNNSAHSSESSKTSPTTLQKMSFESCKSDLSTPLTRVPENITKHSVPRAITGPPYVSLRNSNAASTTTKTNDNSSSRKPSAESMRSESQAAVRDAWR
eukprot:GEMP01003013.1.p1 GENE.GEMP01003013.1~~GEMP01003013.1.p1  ORF type:complete len:994 (+),score=223.38 GEMP01003013.1:53-3034(+)